MAAEGDFEVNLHEILSALEEKGFNFTLKPDQEKAVRQLYYRKDLIAVLPTGYGKSLIFQLLVLLAKKRDGNQSASVIVICPLTSIVQDQLLEVEAMGITACSLDQNMDMLCDIERGKYSIVYASAESAIDKRFLESLKKDTAFSRGLVACVVDKSHTLETWTGLRGKRSKTLLARRNNAVAFRGAYGQICLLRSFFRTGTPMAAFTGTADCQTCDVICSQLAMKQPQTLYISPNRENLRFSVSKTTKDGMFDKLGWLIDETRKRGEKADKTIIFCNTMNDIAVVVNYLIFRLGRAAYHPPDSRNASDCLIGIYHSNSWPDSKDRVLKSFKGQGKVRIVVASTAISMGVNFPDVRYIVNWGPARNLLDLHQEAGRAGRDGLPSHVLIIYHGHQLSHCEEQVKEFVKNKGCLRVAAYKYLDNSVKPLETGHSCCSFCTHDCKCAGDNCDAVQPLFEHSVATPSSICHVTRPVSNEDKEDLTDTLNEIRDKMGAQHVVFDSTSSHGFSTQLVEDVVRHSYRLFTINDILETCPVYLLTHAIKILEVVQEIFLDIPNFDEAMDLLRMDEVDMTGQLQKVLEDIDLSDFSPDSDVEDELPEVLTDI